MNPETDLLNKQAMESREKTPLIRVVRLTLNPESVDDFLSMFNAVKEKIRHFDGCIRLELLRDTTYANIVTTYSVWVTASALNAYRSSELFTQTWQKTKTMFAAPPTAQSYTKIDEIH